jgi:hypothetical protein
MRALMSIDVSFKPAEGDDGSHYPTAEQIAEAFTTVGLQSPSLLARQHPSEQEPTTTSESVVFQKLAKVATAVVEGHSQAQDDVLQWATTARGSKPPPSFAGLAREHLGTIPNADDNLVVSLASYALPVLMRMPARNAEDRERRRLAAEDLVYASVVTPTRSQFVVSSENQSAVTVRLHNQLIERLQQGCEDLLRLLAAPVAVAGGTIAFDLRGRIEIYEVGQEDSTISGKLVGFTVRDRLHDLAETERVGVLVGCFLLLAFATLFVFLFIHHLNHGSVIVSAYGAGGHFYSVQSDQFWLGQAERLQSGVVPVLLVTGLTLLVKYPRGQVVRWTQLLRPETNSANTR